MLTRFPKKIVKKKKKTFDFKFVELPKKNRRFQLGRPLKVENIGGAEGGNFL